MEEALRQAQIIREFLHIRTIMAALERRILFNHWSKYQKYHAVTIYEQNRIVPSPKLILKLDILEPIFDMYENVYSKIGTRYPDILHAVHNGRILSWPRTVLYNLHRKICVSPLLRATNKKHVHISCLVLAKNRASTTSKLRNFNPAASCRQTIDAFSNVVQSYAIPIKRQ